jgi:hypothetical protein
MIADNRLAELTSWDRELLATELKGLLELEFDDIELTGFSLPESVLFGRNARRFKRSDVGAWCAAGGPSAYTSKGDPGAVRR